MIQTINLKFGKGPSMPPETIAPTGVTVFVGPNNSGKSSVLREILRFCREGSYHEKNAIINNIELQPHTAEEVKLMAASVSLKPMSQETVRPDHILVGKPGSRHHLNEKQFMNALGNPNQNQAAFCQWFLSYNTLFLDGHNRINLVQQKPAGDLQKPADNSLQVLMRDKAKRSEIRRIIHEAFGRYFVIDPTNMSQLRIRLSERAPKEEIEEIGIHPEAVKFHSEAQEITEASDGVKAFTGIITEIVAGDPSVLIIDEPEAFLHPALAYKLGLEIAKATNSTKKRVFIATHSPNFVMGCIQSGVPVNITRLTYRDKSPTARILPNNDILRLMRNPLLRSTNVLSGLFYESVIVSESDSDRAFYQEVNERLLRFHPDRGIPNALFLNAQNKQTVQTIIKPLRELGIPAAGIVDVDILKEGGQVFINFLSSANIPAISQAPLSTLRASLNKRCEESGMDMKKSGGVSILSPADLAAANDLFDQLQGYGLFVVRGGELESWLKSLNAKGHGSNWLIDIFQKMGEDPENGNYVKPSENDVWAFMLQVRQWLLDPAKKGIPT